VQLLLEVERDERARAEPVDVHPARARDRFDHRFERLHVQLLGGLLDRPRVRERHLAHDLAQVVTGADVAAEVAVGAHGRAGRVGGQRYAQLRVPADADGLAEPGHRCLAGARGLGDLGDAAVCDGRRVVQHDLGDPLLRPGQAGQE
jgi:hypothetical protein